MDEEKVGITFVDLLFALVVGEILTPLQRWWTIPATGWSHLAVALVLAVASWIGYHTSANRPRYSIKILKLALCAVCSRHCDGHHVLADHVNCTSARTLPIDRSCRTDGFCGF